MKFVHKIPIFFFSLFYPTKFYGKENIPEGKAVLVSNHFHTVDCGLIARIYSKDIYFLAKKELFKNKFFGKILKSYGGIPIDRDKPDMQSLLTSLRVLKDGHKLVVFPEGTRNRTGTTEIQPLKSGAMVFAVKAKSPIVPIIIGSKPKFLRKNHVIIGEPFELDSFYDKKLDEKALDELDELVRNKMCSLQKQLYKMIAKKRTKKTDESYKG